METMEYVRIKVPTSEELEEIVSREKENMDNLTSIRDKENKVVNKIIEMLIDINFFITMGAIMLQDEKLIILILLIAFLIAIAGAVRNKKDKKTICNKEGIDLIWNSSRRIRLLTQLSEGKIKLIETNLDNSGNKLIISYEEIDKNRQRKMMIALEEFTYVSSSSNNEDTEVDFYTRTITRK